ADAEPRLHAVPAGDHLVDERLNLLAHPPEELLDLLPDLAGIFLDLRPQWRAESLPQPVEERRHLLECGFQHLEGRRRQAVDHLLDVVDTFLEDAAIAFGERGDALLDPVDQPDDMRRDRVLDAADGVERTAYRVHHGGGDFADAIRDPVEEAA